jgi:hypothetical protein
MTILLRVVLYPNNYNTDHLSSPTFEGNKVIAVCFMWFVLHSFFYICQWAHYHTGVLDHQGVTEAQYFNLLMILLLAVPSDTRREWFGGFDSDLFMGVRGKLGLSDEVDGNTIIWDFKDLLELAPLSACVPLTIFTIGKVMWLKVLRRNPSSNAEDSESDTNRLSSSALSRSNGQLGHPLVTLIPWFIYGSQFWYLTHFSGVRLIDRDCQELVFIATQLHLVYLCQDILVAGLCTLRFPILHKATLPLTVYCGLIFVVGIDGFPFRRSDEAEAIVAAAGGNSSSASSASGAEGFLTHAQILFGICMWEVCIIGLYAYEVISSVCEGLQIPFLAPLKQPFDMKSVVGGAVSEKNESKTKKKKQ